MKNEKKKNKREVKKEKKEWLVDGEKITLL